MWSFRHHDLLGLGAAMSGPDADSVSGLIRAEGSHGRALHSLGCESFSSEILCFDRHILAISTAEAQCSEAPVYFWVPACEYNLVQYSSILLVNLAHESSLSLHL
ncbi:hypothetical protein ACQJBY_030697 [Aegilops geniculata]